jgi:hypothetical protein
MSPFTSLAAALQSPAPWLLPHVPLAERLLRARYSDSVAAVLNAVRPTPDGVRFVEQAALPAGEAYEAFIHRTACVPTRDNVHDLFNGMIWLSYPRTKQRLNELQAQQIALHGICGTRGPLRDALTLFDENAAILQAPAVLVDALRTRDWRALFVEHRAQWHSARLLVFGHALMEKLLQPRKSITAHVWTVEALSDEAIASSLDPQRLTAKPFLPLPVLGVPGWTRANEDPRFYDDADVFRPAPARSTLLAPPPN